MAELDVPLVVVPTVEWQELPEDLLEAVCGLLAPRELRRARLVCKRWGRRATFQAASLAVQPYVLDMQRDPMRWKQLLTTGANTMPQLRSFQVHLSSRVEVEEAEENLAQLAVFSNLTDLQLVHIVGTVNWLVEDTYSMHRPVLGCNWPLPLQALQHLPSLKRLTLQTAKLATPAQLQALSAVSRLTHLGLNQDNVDQGCVVEVHLGVLANLLMALPSLTSLELQMRCYCVGSNNVAYELSRLVGLEELKVNLFQYEDEDEDDNPPSYPAGLLAAVLPPLTRLTRLEMGKMTSDSQHFNDALRQYADTLPAAHGQEQQAGGTPGRPLLHLDVVLVEGEGAAGGGVDQQVLDTLAPQIAHLRVTHAIFRAAPHHHHHPAITEHACIAQQQPIAAITYLLSSTPNVTSLLLRPVHFTDADMAALVSPCPHLTSLEVFYKTNTGGQLMAGVVSQDGHLLTNLRTLTLHCSSMPPRPQPGDESTRNWLFLHFLPPRLQKLSLSYSKLDTGVPNSDSLLGPSRGGTAASVGGRGLQEVTLSHCSLTGLGIVGLLRQCTSLQTLSMANVTFCGGFVADDDPKDGLFPRSVTSLQLDSCQYHDEAVPGRLAGHRGYAWVCTLRNLRNLEWTGGLALPAISGRSDSSDIMQVLPEVLPSLRKLHNLRIPEPLHGYGFEKFIRQILRDLPSADYITTMGQDPDDDGISMEEFDADMLRLLDMQLARLGYTEVGDCI